MLIFAAGLALGQSTLFSTVVQHPDAANGYEDYVRAAEILKQGHIDDYFGWERFVYSGMKDDDPAPTCPEGLNQSGSDLEIREQIAQRFNEALDALAVGNSKAIHDPRDRYTPDTMFPEMMYFKRLAECASMSAGVEFAHGRSDIATNELVAGLRFSHRIGVSTLIHRLVGIACDSILEAELSRHLPQLSLEDAQKLHAYADEILSMNSLGAQAIRRDAQITVSSVDLLLSNPSTVMGGGSLASADPEDKAVFDRLAKMAPADREALKPQLVERIKAFVNQVARVLEGPEGDWESGANALDPNDGTLAGRIVTLLLPSYHGVVQAEARDRVKGRLIRLNAMVIEYRWVHTKLPDNLEDFTEPEERKDPFTGATYTYKRVGDWYSLTSQGFGGFKTLDLKRVPGSSVVEDTIKP